MEGHRPLDAADGSANRGQTIRAVALALLLVVAASSAVSQNLPAAQQQSLDLTSDANRIKQFYSDQKWDEIVRVVHAPSPDNADLDYYYGSALAQLGRLNDAR